MDEERRTDWSKLPSELLELVAIKLHCIDFLHFKGVCSSFRLAAKVRPSVTPLLMHLSTTDCGDDDDFHRKFGKTVRFMSPRDMNSVIYSPQGKICLERILDKGCCVGSSHGWLVVFDKEVNPFLLNPFSGAEIELPKKETLPGIIDRGYRDIRIDCDGCVPIMSCSMGYGRLYLPMIQKAILTANPSYGDDYKVFIICGHLPTRIAFCCHGDRTWRPLYTSQSQLTNFNDVAFHNGRLYTIQSGMAPPPDFISRKICIWDVSSTLEVPQECGCIVITDFVRQDDIQFRGCPVMYYLVSSSEEFFFVFRFLSGTADNLWDYRTFGFEIYKLEGKYGKEFVRVESLPGQAMFLGGNHGTVISVQDYDNKLRENSIYFTCNYQDVFLKCLTDDEIGIYSLEDGCVNLLCDVQKKKPAPFWVFPGQKCFRFWVDI